MKFFFKYIGVVSCYTLSLAGFDVRVLLHKFTPSHDAAVECKLSSQHGMTISGINQVVQGNISISCTPDSFVVNGVILHHDMLTINPVLSSNYDKKIHDFVHVWHKNNHERCQKKLHQLDQFYEKFVNDRNFRDYDILYTVIQDCMNDCIVDFMQGIEHPVISYESLCLKAHNLLTSRLKILFTRAVREIKISKSLLHQLQRSKKYRTDFFNKILKKILVQLLYDYFVGLPHKIIQQAMKEETGCLLFDKNKYVGTFYVARQGDTVLVINMLDIDDYLLSVVHSEGWPGWPMEVYKALVIAIRTYLVEKVLQANKAKRLYHIVNSIKHQTYKGHHKYHQLKQAVDETRNIFIAYKGEPIVAMFDACCGGIVPAKIEGPNFATHPYLARNKACSYCKKFWIYDWKKELSKLEITQALAQDHPDIDMITDIKVTKRDPAGLVKQVLVTSKKKSFYVSGKKMYSLFPAIKSFCYTIKKKGALYCFQGRGYGHHMGLCQWGVLGMVKDHWNYTKILEFYYPGTEFMKLTLAR